MFQTLLAFIVLYGVYFNFIRHDKLSPISVGWTMGFLLLLNTAITYFAGNCRVLGRGKIAAGVAWAVLVVQSLTGWHLPF